jgi:hypothetical protein
VKISPRRFTVEEFPDQQDWIGNLISPINQTTQELVTGLSNNLTIDENLYQEIKELKFINNAANFPLRFKTKFNKLPMGLSIIYCKDSSGGTASNMPWPTWDFNNGLLSITSITNLTNDFNYTLRVHIIYS